MNEKFKEKLKDFLTTCFNENYDTFRDIFGYDFENKKWIDEIEYKEYLKLYEEFIRSI